MRTNRFLIAGLVLGGILGASYAARYVRRQQYSALASDPLLGWNDRSTARSPAEAAQTRRDPMPSPTAPLDAS